MDEFRLVKGTAKWVANFTASTSPYVTGKENEVQGNYDLAPSGAATTSIGKFGNGYDLAGGYLLTTPLSLANDFTLGAWIKLDTLPAAGSVAGIISRQDGVTRQYQMDLYNDAGDMQLYIGNSVLPAGDPRADSTDIVVNNWIFTCATKSSVASGSLKGYVNGKLVVQATDTGNNGAPTSDTFIGAAADSTSSSVDGRIDEVFLIDRCWTQKEVTDYYSWAKGRMTKLL
jgi:hypothetical protein